MIIDFHTHVLPPRIKADRRIYVKKDAAFAAIYSGEKVTIATAEDLIAAMDRDGVDISLIVNYSWTTHDLCVETNDYILESVNRYPDRLYGFCAISSCLDDSSLKEIERCALAGARGIGELRPDTETFGFTGPESIKAFAVLLQEYKLVVLTHASEPVGHQYPGKGKATPDVLCRFIESLGDLPVICAHWGGGLPFYTLMPEVQRVLENVYFDTAVSPFLYSQGVYRQVADLVGTGKILFGSDYPVMSAGRIIREIDAAGLPPADKESILAGNARGLLRI
jgi:predicted TIM-barrel fold metal-dependent hydrolase